MTQTIESQLGALLDSAADAFVVVDGDGQIALVNAQAERIFGYARNELLGQHVQDLVPDWFAERGSGDPPAHGADPPDSVSQDGGQHHGRRKNGSLFPVELSLSQVETDQGALISSVIRDISQRRSDDREMLRARAVIESAREAFIGKELDGTIVSWNPGAERLYGYSALEAIGRPISMLVPPGQEDRMSQLCTDVLTGEIVGEVETVTVHKDGTQVDVSLSISPIRDPQGVTVGVSTIARDISARLRRLEKLQFLADHDALTGARNRRRFERDVSDQVGRARRYGEQAGLLIVDINDFKQINDTFGHRAGDMALQAIAVALNQRLRESDLVARIGGDEFAIILPYSDPLQTESVAADLRRVIAECRVTVEEHRDLRLSASVGHVQIAADAISDELILAAADAAMYADKSRTRTDR